MAFMKKNINFGLMLIVIALLVGFTGFSIYYQTTYLKLSKDYKAKVAELGDVSKALNLERSTLNQTSLQLQIKEEREQDLGTKYTVLKGQRDQLEVDKVKLQADVSQKNQKILELSNEVSKLEVDVINVKTQLDDANSEISSLNKVVKEWKDKAKCWEDRSKLVDAEEAGKSC